MSAPLDTTLADVQAPTTKLEHALRAAQHGTRVHPCRPNSKKALVEGWPELATTDEAIIRQWWTDGRKRNIGWAMGDLLPNGRFTMALDVDMKRDAEDKLIKDGEASFEALCERLGLDAVALLKTRAQFTPSGLRPDGTREGRHMIFSTSKPVVNNTDVLGPGLDVRGKRGYVVGDGSTLDGRAYEVVDWNAPILELPAAIEALLSPAPDKTAERDQAPTAGVDPARALDRAQHFLLAAPVGIEGDKGDVTTFRVAAECMNLGLTEVETLDLLLEDWNERCSPPWTPEALAKKVRNARKYMREPQGSKAPEAIFEPVEPGEDPLANVESWTAEQITENIQHLVTLRHGNPKKLESLAQGWDAFDVILWDELSGLLLDAELLRLNLDTAVLTQDPAALADNEIQLALATLARRNPEAYLILVKRLVAGGLGKRPINKATNDGENLLRKDDAKRARDKDGRASVRLNGANLTETLDDIEEAILLPSPIEQVFSFARHFVTVRKTKPVTVREMSGGDHPPVPIIFHYDVPAMRERITKSVRLEALDRHGVPVAKTVSGDLALMLLSRGGGDAPALTGIIDGPTIRQDGSMLTEEGYDKRTGLLAVFNGQIFPEVPRRPSKKDAQEALRFIQDEVFAEFPFRDTLDLTVATAALLTGLVRSAIGIAPAFLISAPIQSSGKTALAEVIAHGAYGRQPAVSSWPADDVEMAKVILAKLKEGNRTVLFDNLKDGCVVNSSQLAAAISSEQFSSRILGVSDTATVPTSTLWIMTGNNVHLAGDMPTRVLRLYLDAKDERPDQRHFRRDLAPWIAEHRAQIVQAGLTIIRFYIAAGCPEVADTATRFPHWDKMVRYPLIHAGAMDVGAKFTNSVLDDPTLAPWAEVLEAWHSLFGSEDVLTGDVLDRLEAADLSMNAAESPEVRVKEALKVAMNDSKFVKISAGSLGTKLRQYENRPLGALKLTSSEDLHRKVKRWRVERVGR